MKDASDQPETKGEEAGKVTNELRLSLALRKVIEERANHDLTLGYIIEVTGERAFGILMAFLCLPFIQPIPIPIASIPFGLALAFLGVQLALGWHRPWLPKRMANWRLPPKSTAAILRGVAKVFKPLEKIIKPRLFFMQNRVSYVLVGAGLVANGLLLAVLPPIPGSNLIPAWMALIIILGLTEEDGITMLVGLILTSAATAIGIAILLFGTETVTHAIWPPPPPSTPPTTMTAPATVPATATAPTTLNVR